ncbi:MULTISPECIES: hypothetical protein [Dietzia]|uniref:hypothetical protein n=1 Tax=Dietzia TaxID=37914 RepID=UPI0019D2958D|nr:hypothetical protein [Dietzia sp. KRD202]
MPDFSAISAALTAVKNLIDGVVSLTGSLTGDGLNGALELAGFSSDAVETTAN